MAAAESSADSSPPSLETSKSNVNNSVQQLFTAFESTKLKDEPGRAKPIYDKAKSASAIINDLNQYINSIKEELIYLLKDGVEDNNGDDPIPENISKKFPSLN